MNSANLPSAWRIVRKVLVRLLAYSGAFLLIVLVMVGAAAWYTSRPTFCGSCHIMEPYIKSWQESAHKDVSCVDCHFAPGLGGKVRGKLLGLVQLAKYVTSSQGPRPAAEIPDESCLRCHEARLLSGRVQFHGILFDHTPHLAEMRRGKKLRCTSCHGQIVQGTHMSVTESTCYLCHFKDEPFNEGLGACTRCHQIPTAKFDLGGGATFTHDLAFEKGVDCAACHGDVIRGKGDVPRERCRTCHNQPDDLAKAADHEFMHRKHVTDHKVDCLDCHLEIQHSLDRDKIAHSAGDCVACHPTHHKEQVDMFRGVGGRTLHGEKAGMASTRIDCRSCHRAKDVSGTGSVLWRASAEACSMCHAANTMTKLESYHGQIKLVLAELEGVLSKVREAVKAAAPPAERAAEAAKAIDDLQADLAFLRKGSYIHNVHYADSLARAVNERVLALCRQWKAPEPKTPLPPKMSGLK